MTDVWTIMLRDLAVDEPTIAAVGQDLKQWLAQRGLEAGIVTVDSAYLRRALSPQVPHMPRAGSRQGKDSNRL